MTIKSKLKLAIIPMLFSLAGCGGGGGGNPTGIEITECTNDAQNRFVYDVMQDIYLYYDQIPAVNPTDYTTPRALLADIIAPNDRFSFIADQQRQNDFFEEGTFNGLGFSFGTESDAEGENYTVRFVYDDSSAGRAGLKRGDQILAIEGISVTQINADGGIAQLLSNYEDGEALSVSVKSAGEEPENLTMSKGLVRINTVLKTDVINSNNLNVGYLAFSSFIEPSKAELSKAFTFLKQQNIDELVLDLRYNGGGRIDVAQTLASYIAGDTGLGADVTKLVYNDKNSNLNSDFPFRPLANSIDLDRLYVLTLEGTCSASEIIINAMQPIGIDVVTIGQTTCGKPVGSRNINFCDKTLSAISFDVVNDINRGDYENGIAATCAANDDTSSLFADPNEEMFATALYHIENGSCPVASREVGIQTERKNPLNKPDTIPGDLLQTLY